jgi:O-antigen/teichoic acid export membrane protein
MIIICGILLWGNIFKSPFQIEWLIYSQTLAYLLTLLVALFIVIKKSKFHKLNWNLVFLRMVIKKSLPYALLVFLMGIYSRVDAVLIERMLPGNSGEFQSGIFAQAYRLFDAGNNIALLFGVILLPMFSRMLKKGESVEKLIKLSFTIIFTFALIIAFSSYFYSEEIIKILYNQHDNETLTMFNERNMEASKIFGILMFSFVAVCTTYIFGTLLTALGDLRYLIKVALLGVVINLMINLIFIPTLEAVGAAYASFGAQFITAVALVIGAQKRFTFSINYRYLIQLLSFILAVFAINYFSKTLSLKPIWGFTTVLLVSIASAYALKLLNVRAFIRLLKEDTEEN